MESLQIFKNDEFGEVRSTIIDDEPWFIGKDVAVILGYKNPQKALRDHVDTEDRTVNETFTVNGTAPILINESGLYALIVLSKLPSAKKFKRWITSEVIPTIRKTGGYVANDDLFLDTYLSYADEQTRLLFKTTLQTMRAQDKKIAKQQDKIIALNNENDILAREELTWADRPLINAIVRRYAANVYYSDFARAWVAYKKELLYKHGIDLNARRTNYLNRTGKKTSPKVLGLLSDEELPMALSCVVAMCREKNIQLDDLLNKTNTCVIA